MTPAITLVIADDHPLIRAGLRTVLDDMPTVTVVAEVDSGEAAVDAVDQYTPSVVLMDLLMPGIGGFEATRRICDTHPDTKVLVLTMNDEDAALVEALQAGACGYLVKGAGYGEIQAAVNAAAAGETVLSGQLAPRLLSLLRAAPRADAAARAGLSTREQEVLALLASGSGTAEIARRLFLSPKTVRNHVSMVLAKLDVPDRAQAIAWAHRAGLGASPEKRPTDHT
jgi:DNA-binding NarL/FixJ family response regulator